MKAIRFLATLTALVAASACGDGRNVQPTAPSFTALAQSPNFASSDAGPIQTSGHFDAIVDFSTVTLTPKGQNCLLQVAGRAVFSGTIVGTGIGQTSALEFAPCADVAAHPPGTFPDVFHFDGVFEGTVGGQPARANIRYMGRVQVGGAIDGRFVFSNGVAGEVDVDAVVAVGGTYRGSVVVK